MAPRCPSSPCATGIECGLRGRCYARRSAYQQAGEATSGCRKSQGHRKGACVSEVDAEAKALAAWKLSRKDAGTAKGGANTAKAAERSAERQLESASNKLVSAQTQFGTASNALQVCKASSP